MIAPDRQGMTYRPLGRCGMKVSQFGLGGWTTFGESVADESKVRAIIHQAYAAGINFFDSADIYAKGECEKVMGKALADLPRHELVISSKVFFPMSDDPNDRGLSRKHITESIDKTLQRMGLDYLDIYFCHRFDEETPLAETVGVLNDLIARGKILYWGTSEWTGVQLRKGNQACENRLLRRPVVEQPQYSLLARDKLEHDVRPAASDLGMGLVTWSPLAYGILTGKYDAGVPKDSRLDHLEWLREGSLTEDRIERVRKFKTIADKLGASRAQVALAWAAAQPGISSVILGVTSEQQLEENLGARRVKLDLEDLKALNELFPPTGRLRS